MSRSKEIDFSKLFNHYFETTNNSCSPKNAFISIFSDDKPQQTAEKSYSSPFYKTEIGIRWANFLIQQYNKKNHFSQFKKDMSFLSQDEKISKVSSYKKKKSMKNLLSPMKNQIKRKYSYFRNVFRDGNTFFRAVAFSFLEQMLFEKSMERLLQFLIAKLPSLLFISPIDVGNKTLLTESATEHKMLMGEYMIEKLANLAEKCIHNFERDEDEENSDDSEESKKGKERGELKNSNLLRELFNDDKFFDFSVVMFARTILYECAEDKKKKKRLFIQCLCQDVRREVSVENKIFMLMARALDVEIGFFKNQEEYGCVNNKEEKNICIQLFVEEGEEEIPVYSIAYKKNFAKNNLLF